MKYLIKESQYKRLITEQVITEDGFVKVTDKTKIGILNPLGEITLVPSGTTITTLNSLKDTYETFDNFKKWKGTTWEGWIPSQDQILEMEGMKFGKGPTVGCFKEPDGGRYCAAYQNIHFMEAHDKPRPEGWKFVGYYPKNTKNKKQHKGGSYHPDRVIDKRPKEATGKTVMQKFDDIDDLNTA